MNYSDLSRRDWLKTLGIGAVAGSVMLNQQEANAETNPRGRANALAGTKVNGLHTPPCKLAGGKVVRPESAIPAISETDVLVVGGGAAGCAAAIAAARAGVKVTLVERYNHFGGLITGGLVLKILSHRAKDVEGLCARGITEEQLDRLEKMSYGDNKFGYLNSDYRNSEPDLDAEVYKYLLVEMITEENIEVYLHSWALDAIMDGNVCRGAVIQTKQGAQAIIAKQVIDTTGDGDIFASAGCDHEIRIYNIGLVHRIGNLDKAKPEPGAKRPRNLGGGTPIPGVNWVNMAGPDDNGVDVKVMTRLELNHRKQIWKQMQEIQKTPGYEKTYLVETAPQLGVRVTRVLTAVHNLTWEDAKNKKTFDDVVGIGGAWNGEHDGWQIPYRCMVPVKVDNLLTAGRSTASEPRMSELVRVITPCWVTGQAAGCAAAVAVQKGTTARDVPYADLKKLLLEQKVFLG